MKENIFMARISKVNNDIENEFPLKSYVFGFDQRFIGQVHGYFSRPLGPNKNGQIIGLQVTSIRACFAAPEIEIEFADYLGSGMWDIGMVSPVPRNMIGSLYKRGLISTRKIHISNLHDIF